MKKEPLVSCLCVSEDRPDYLRKAISCFNAQTYVKKELILVSRLYDPEYEEIVSGVTGGEVKYYSLEDKTRFFKLGGMRNYSIAQSSGELFCIWDDDDWHHPMRLEKMVQGILEGKKSGTILPYCLLFDKVNGDVYLSPPTFMHPSSIMVRRDLMGQQDFYKNENHEDLYFRNTLVGKGALYPVVAPQLYIYVYHAANLCNSEHFNKIFGLSSKLRPEFGRMIGDVVNHKYSCEEAVALLNESDLLNELDYFPGLWWPSVE
jgi:glycosyltransferase involved in cell wall biosynthesis